MGRPRLSWLLGGVAALAIFEIPAAYVVARGAPAWLALAVGALAFPVVPLTWHLLRERKRPKAPPKAGATTGFERAVFRCLAVGLLVIGPLVALDGKRVWGGIRHHALWMIPTPERTLELDSPLFAYVPASAESIAWLRDGDDARAVIAKVAPMVSGHGELVIVGSKHGLMIIERGDAGLIDLARSYERAIPVLPKGTVEDLPGGIRRWSTPGWTMGGSPTALFEIMRRAPDDALIVGAMVPRAPQREGYQRAVGWLRIRADRLEAVVDATTSSPAAAQQLETLFDRARAQNATGLACWAANTGTLTLEREALSARVRIAIDVDELRAAFECLDR